MIINLKDNIDKEKELLKQDLIKNKGFETIDDGMVLGIRVPYTLDEDRVEDMRDLLIVAPGVRILTYEDPDTFNSGAWLQTETPWIEFEFSLSDRLNEDRRIEILKWLKDKLQNSEGHKPFQDQDANLDVFTEPYHIEGHREYKYRFFMNWHYPNGMFINHVIDCEHL